MLTMMMMMTTMTSMLFLAAQIAAVS